MSAKSKATRGPTWRCSFCVYQRVKQSFQLQGKGKGSDTIPGAAARRRRPRTPRCGSSPGTGCSPLSACLSGRAASSPARDVVHFGQQRSFRSRHSPCILHLIGVPDVLPVQLLYLVCSFFTCSSNMNRRLRHSVYMNGCFCLFVPMFDNAGVNATNFQPQEQNTELLMDADDLSTSVAPTHFDVHTVSVGRTGTQRAQCHHRAPPFCICTCSQSARDPSESAAAKHLIVIIGQVFALCFRPLILFQETRAF